MDGIEQRLVARSSRTQTASRDMQTSAKLSCSMHLYTALTLKRCCSVLVPCHMASTEATTSTSG